MKKNILYSALLSILLVAPGQTFCAEQPSISKDILGRMWFSMPTAPEWMTNFTTNLTSGLSDTKKYLLYGGGVFLAALLGYIGYKAISVGEQMEEEIPTSIQNRGWGSSDEFGNPDYKDLNANLNRRNIAIIINNYDKNNDNNIRETAFKHYICPVFKHFQDKLSSQEEWQSFLSGVKSSHSETINGKWEPGIRLHGDDTEYGIKILRLINKICPNKNITKPLRELLIEKNSQNFELKQMLLQ